MNIYRNFLLQCLAALIPLTFLLGQPDSALASPLALWPVSMPVFGPRATTDDTTGTIAYSTGSSVRLLWTSPHPTDNGISNVEWRNDGTEIAFISDHESATSVYERDLYAIGPDGTGYRKLTNAPVHERLGDYPTGTVTVDVQVTAGGGGPYLIYLSGAAEPQTITAGTPGTWQLTFHDVADFGATLQPVVAIEGYYRWFNAAAADVQPGQPVHAGTLTISGDGFWHFGAHENKLTWRSDDSRIGFVFGAGCELRQADVQPAAGMQDEPLIEPAVSGFTCMMDWAPVASRANDLLYVENNYFTNEGHIYLTEEGSNAAGEPIINFALPATVLDVEWLPDGSGFLFSITDSFSSNANIYAYTFGATSVTPLTSFTDEFAGAFSLSPDGEYVVFERAASPESTVDLWLMRSDGSQMELLKQNAARPSWGVPSTAPPPSLEHPVYLPMWVRNND